MHVPLRAAGIKSPAQGICLVFRRWTIAKKAKAKGHEQQIEAARAVAIAAARLAAQTRCHNVVILDVRGLSSVTDFMVIATGTSPRQMKAVADQLEEMAEASSYRALSRAGDGGEATWIALDLFQIMVHLFDQETRMFYDLDGLWGDAPKVEWEPATVKV